MQTPLYLDPLEAWREALGKVEGGVNALSSRVMNSDQFARALHHACAIALGTQHVLAKGLDGYFRTLGLSSRKDINELAVALQRIEENLERRTPEARPGGPRPVRTRRPPSEGAPPAPASTGPIAVIAPDAPARRSFSAAKPARRPNARRARPGYAQKADHYGA